MKYFKRFESFSLEDINELSYLEDLDLNKREDILTFMDAVKHDNLGSYRKSHTDGYEFEIQPKYVDVLDKLDVDFEVETVTNKEHPDYGSKYLRFHLFLPRKEI